MKVSVIVTTYNNPSALKRVLDGFLFQRRLPDELIVADDGSGVETEEVIKSFSKKASFHVKHVWQENRGFRAAKIRNEAIKKTDADYIILLDGDCIPNRHFVDDHLRLKERGLFVQGKRILMSKKASETFTSDNANSPFSLFGLLVSNSISNPHHLIRVPFFPALRYVKLRGIKSCNMGIFRDDLIAVNGFNEAFVGWGREDSELAVRLYRYGLKRKQHPFMAICFHLWHLSHPRDTLSINDKILEETIKNEVYSCANGIVKK